MPIRTLVVADAADNLRDSVTRLERIASTARDSVESAAFLKVAARQFELAARRFCEQTALHIHDVFQDGAAPAETPEDLASDLASLARYRSHGPLVRTLQAAE